MTILKYPGKIGRLLFSSLLAVFFLTSCQKQPNLLFGNTYLNTNNSANVVLVDTSTVLLSTVFSDSTATNGTGFLMAGSCNDPSFGNVTSRAFWQVTPPSSLPAITPAYDHYDSIGLILFFKKSNPWYGDTTYLQNYVVNQVDSLYQLNLPFQNSFFSNNSLPVDPNPLGQTGPMFIFPNRGDTVPLTSQAIGDTVKIKLRDDIGQQIYNMVYTLSDTVKNPTTWLNWFHGLCLSTPAAAPGITGAVYGFKDSAIMRIYYREVGVVGTEKFIDFNITNRSLAFNNIHTNYGNMSLRNLKTKNDPGLLLTPPATVSSLTGNAAYLQTITGLNVKLTFPTLQAIAQRPDYIGLLRATLTVRPVLGSFDLVWRLPPQLGIYSTDQNNGIGVPIPATGVAGAQTGNLLWNVFEPTTTAYTYDVTAFVKNQITNTASNWADEGLMLSIPAPANVSDFRRMVIADQTYQVNQRTQLSVYYISLFPHN